MSIYRVPLQVYVDVEATSAEQADQEAAQHLASRALEQPSGGLFQVHTGQAALFQDAPDVPSPTTKPDEEPEIPSQWGFFFRLLVALVVSSASLVKISNLIAVHHLLSGSPHAILTYWQHWWAGEDTKSYRALGFVPMWLVGRIGKFLEFTSALVIIFDIYNEPQFVRAEQGVVEGLRQTVRIGRTAPSLLPHRDDAGLAFLWLLDSLRRYLQTGKIKYENLQHTGKRLSFYVLILGFMLDIFSA